MKEKKNYIIPEVEVMVARVERGFDVSGSQSNPQGLSTQQMQSGEGSAYQWN